MTKKGNPFDQFKRINKSYDKPTEEDLESFNSFLAEKYYSHYYDTCMLAELASRMNVPEYIYETFYRGVVDKETRKHFWPKSEKDERINLIIEYYDVSVDKAKEIETLIPNSVYMKIENMKDENKRRNN